MNSEKRYQVFVSSTYIDLVDERQAVVQSLLRLNAIPSGMELFPAGNEDAWKLIKKVIDDCDYYLLIVGGRYGQVDPVKDISWTEKEYDYACSKKKPVLAFLHGDEEGIPLKKGERSDDGRKKLAAFRDKIRNRRHVRYWTELAGLRAEIAESWAHFIEANQAVGWIRANRQTSAESFEELNTLRKKVAALESELEAVATGPPPGTEYFAQGSDPFRFVVNLQCAYTRETNDDAWVDVWHELVVEWDLLFRFVGSSLLSECDEAKVKERLNDALLKEYILDDSSGLRRRLYDEITQALGISTVEDDRVVELQLTVQDDDFSTILVQFVALGLIAEVQHRQGDGALWTLTPYGRTRLVQLRAVRRTSDSAPAREVGPTASSSTRKGKTKSASKSRKSNPAPPLPTAARVGPAR